MKNFFNFGKVALIFRKFFHPSQVGILLWLIFLMIFLPFLAMRISLILDIQITGELPPIFDNSFFFHLFTISWFLYLPIIFLEEKTFTILGNSLFSVDNVFKTGFDILLLLISILYAYSLSCSLKFLLVIKTKVVRKHIRMSFLK